MRFWICVVIVAAAGDALAQQRSTYEGKVRQVQVVPIPAPNLTREQRRRAIMRMQPQYFRFNFTNWQPITLEDR